MDAVQVQQSRITAWLLIGATLAVLVTLLAVLWLRPDALQVSLVVGAAVLASGLGLMVATGRRRPEETQDLRIEGAAAEADDEEHVLRFHCSRCNHFSEAADSGARPLQVVCTRCGKQGVVD